MNVELKRIKKESFDELLEKIGQKFSSEGIEKLNEDDINNESVSIKEGRDLLCVDIDINQYMEIVEDASLYTYDKAAKISMLLYRDFAKIPNRYLYEKEFWAYLSLTHFFDVVKLLRLDDDEKVTPDKIKRYYFNAGTISRTGLLYLWVMADRLDATGERYDVVHTAFEFIDPVKAIFERTMSRNPMILQAFVQGIINNGKDSRFKNNILRLKVPNNISCFAGVNMLDAYDYDELVEVVSRQQKEILDLYTQN